MKLRFSVLLLTASMFSMPALAQEPTVNPAVTHLMKSYRLTREEAQTRVDLLTDILALSERLNADGDAAYGDMYIQQEPTFKVMILFADQSDRKAFLDSIDPKLRRYVQLKVAKKSRGLATRELDALNAALTALSVPFTSKYDLPTERFVVTVDSEAAAQRVKTALPETRKVETVVQVAPLPKIQSRPVGVVAGDRFTGGDGLRRAGSTGPGPADCTLAYAVNYTFNGVAKKGILTAGHCANTMQIYINGHDITLSGPDIDRPNRDTDGLSDKFDFQIFEATGATVDNLIRYFDQTNNSNYELRLTAISSFLNQKAGMPVCKSGAKTGITCGTITNGNASWDGVAGWIEVSNSQQAVISLGGDSGGPWFLNPGSASTITGFGLHTAGNDVYGPSGVALYMPIDYIDDQNSSVNTIKQ